MTEKINETKYPQEVTVWVNKNRFYRQNGEGPTYYDLITLPDGRQMAVYAPFPIELATPENVIAQLALLKAKVIMVNSKEKPGGNGGSKR